MYKISVVSYLNSIPFKYGLENSDIKEFFEIEYDIPSTCAQKLLTNKVDIGLVPVAILANNPDLEIVAEYGIAANKFVKSVKLFSTVPLNEIKTIYLDEESHTSNALCRILCKELWNINPEFIKRTSNKEVNLDKENANVIIGDRALEILGLFPFEYDFAEEWHKLTGNPFVFAAWTANKEIAPEALEALNNALLFGINNYKSTLPEVKKKYPGIDVEDYLNNCIQYDITDEHALGLQKFLNYLR